MWAGGGMLGGAGTRAALAGSKAATRTGACPMGSGMCGVHGAGTHAGPAPATATRAGACPMARGLGSRHKARCLPEGFARAFISFGECAWNFLGDRDRESSRFISLVESTLEHRSTRPVPSA